MAANLFESISRLWPQDSGHNESHVFPVEIQGFYQLSTRNSVTDPMQSIGESVSFSLTSVFFQHF